MNKCQKCGTEFDGKFCPECGTEWLEEKTCPSCGAAVAGTAKFCNHCGYAFTAKAARQTRVSGGGVKVLATLWKSAPKMTAVLFVVFALLLFAFFAAPVAKTPETEFFGEKIPSQSVGNVYQLMAGKSPLAESVDEVFGGDDEMNFQTPFTILVVFAVLTLAAASFIAAISFGKALEGKEVRFGDTHFPLETVAGYLSAVFYLIYIVLASIICGEVTKADGGMDVVKIGAAPKLLLAFSIVFLVLVGALLAFRIVFAKLYPDWKTKEDKEREERIAREKAAAEEKRLDFERRFAEQELPAPPEAVAKPNLRKYPLSPLIRQANSFMRFKRLLFTLTYAGLAMMIGFAGLDILFLEQNQPSLGILIIIGGIIEVVAPVYFVIAVIQFFKRSKNFSIKKTPIVVALISDIVLQLLSCIINTVLLSKIAEVLGEIDVWWLEVLIPLVMLAMCLLFALITLSKRKKLCTALFGTPEPSRDAEAVRTEDELFRYLDDADAYRRYVTDAKVYAYKKRCQEKHKLYDEKRIAKYERSSVR